MFEITKDQFDKINQATSFEEKAKTAGLISDEDFIRRIEIIEAVERDGKYYVHCACKTLDY